MGSWKVGHDWWLKTAQQHRKVRVLLLLILNTWFFRHFFFFFTILQILFTVFIFKNCEGVLFNFCISLCFEACSLCEFGAVFFFLNLWLPASKLSYNNFCFQIPRPLRSLLLPCFRVFLFGRMWQSDCIWSPRICYRTHEHALSVRLLCLGEISCHCCVDPQAVPWRGSSGRALRPSVNKHVNGWSGQWPLTASQGLEWPQPSWATILTVIWRLWARATS